MKLNGAILGLITTSLIGFTGCKIKDADIKASIETSLKAATDVTGITVNVENGIAFMEGRCKDENCKANFERIAQEVTGVKTVISNLTIASAPAPVIIPVVAVTDNTLIKSVDSVAKGFPTVRLTVNDSIVKLTGYIKKRDLPKLMTALSSLNPKKIEKNLKVARKRRLHR